MGLECQVVSCNKNKDSRCSDENIIACYRRAREGARTSTEEGVPGGGSRVIETRVEDLIEDYMKYYETTFEEAKEIMIEDLKAAEEEG